MSDEDLQEAFIRVKKKFEGHQREREAFYCIRDGFTPMIESCANNVRVVLYVDDILDEPIVVKMGDQENRLRITIKTNGTVTYNWDKETWGKIFKGVAMTVNALAKKLVSLFKSIAESSGAIGHENRLPIAY